MIIKVLHNLVKSYKKNYFEENNNNNFSFCCCFIYLHSLICLEACNSLILKGLEREKGHFNGERGHFNGERGHFNGGKGTF
jgi:hypothetical protein